MFIFLILSADPTTPTLKSGKCWITGIFVSWTSKYSKIMGDGNGECLFDVNCRFNFDGGEAFCGFFFDRYLSRWLRKKEITSWLFY
jgi:hypothetical protein